MPILKRILVATDLSEAAHFAVMRAGQLARQWNSALYLVHARPDWNLFSRWGSANQDAYEDINQRANDKMRELLAELATKFSVHARCDSRMGKASSVVDAVASDWEPHLIVLGANGEHDSFRPQSFLGGTALKLLSQINLPLLFVRAAPENPYATSLVAVDIADDLSRRAIDWASSLVPGGDCHLVHVYGAPYIERMRFGANPDAVLQTRMQQASDAAQTMSQDLLSGTQATAQMHAHVVNGEPVAAILSEVTARGPQLVVVGRRKSHGRLGTQDVMGGTGFRIAYHTPTDALVVS